MKLSVLLIIDIDFILLNKATFKGWMDIMYAAVDSRDVSVSFHCSGQIFKIHF